MKKKSMKPGVKISTRFVAARFFLFVTIFIYLLKKVDISQFHTMFM